MGNIQNTYADPIPYLLNVNPNLQISTAISNGGTHIVDQNNLNCSIMGPGGGGGDTICNNGTCFSSTGGGGGGGGGGGTGLSIILNQSLIGHVIYIFPGIPGDAPLGSNGLDGGNSVIIFDQNFVLVVPGGFGATRADNTNPGNGGNGGNVPYLILNNDPNNIASYKTPNNFYTISSTASSFGGGAGLISGTTITSGLPGLGFLDGIHNTLYDGENAQIIDNLFRGGAGGGSQSPWGGNSLRPQGLGAGGSGGSYGIDQPSSFHCIIGVDKNCPQGGAGSGQSISSLNNGKPGIPGQGGGGGFGNVSINQGGRSAKGGSGKIIFN